MHSPLLTKCQGHPTCSPAFYSTTGRALCMDIVSCSLCLHCESLTEWLQPTLCSKAIMASMMVALGACLYGHLQ